MRRSWILLPLMLFLTSCSTKHDLPEEALVVTPLPIQKGQDIRIDYYPSHPKAKFKKPDALYATFMVTELTTSATYRIQLERDGDHFTGTYSLPDHALQVEIMVGPKEELMGSENVTGLVCKGENPVRHSLPFAISGGDSYEDALEIFKTDEELYPETPDRYLPMWRGLFESGIDTAGVAHQADSVFRTVTARTQETGTLDSDGFTAATGCLYVYSMLGDFRNAKLAADRLAVYAKENSSIPLLSSSYLGLTWVRLCDKIQADRSTADDITPVLASILETGIELKNPHLLKYFVELGYNPGALRPQSLPQVRALVFSDKYWNRIATIVQTFGHEELLSMGDLLLNFPRTANEKGDYQSTIAVTDKLLPHMDSTELWMRGDPTKPVQILPTPGWEPSMYLDRIEALMALGQKEKAYEYMRSASRRGYKYYSIWLIGRSAIGLAKHYADEGNLDSAMQYLGWVMVIKPPDRKEAYDYVKAKFGNALPTPEVLRKKYFRADLLKTKPCPPMTLKTGSKTYTLGKKNKDTLLLLFASKTCGICRVAIPEMIKEMRQTGKTVPKIVIVTDEPKKQFQSYMNGMSMEGIEFAHLEDGMLKSIGEAGTPAYALVRGGEILSSGGVGPMTYRVIEDLE